MDAIEKALRGTLYEDIVRALFYGEQTSVIMCLECGNSRGRPDPFLEILLTVKGMKDLQQSL
jgi:hypothetical protein